MFNVKHLLLVISHLYIVLYFCKAVLCIHACVHACVLVNN